MSDSLWPHGLYSFLQARRLGWVAIPFSRGSSQPRDWTWVSHIAGGFFTSWATRILEWVAYPFSSGSSQPRNQAMVSCIACGFFTSWAIRPYHDMNELHPKTLCFSLIIWSSCNILIIFYFSNLCPGNPKNNGVGCHALLQGIFQPRDQTHVSSISCIGRRVLYHYHHLGKVLRTHFLLVNLKHKSGNIKYKKSKSQVIQMVSYPS